MFSHSRMPIAHKANIRLMNMSSYSDQDSVTPDLRGRAFAAVGFHEDRAKGTGHPDPADQIKDVHTVLAQFRLEIAAGDANRIRAHNASIIHSH